MTLPEVAPAQAVVHMAGIINAIGDVAVQRCRACGRILATVTADETAAIRARQGPPTDLRLFLAHRFYPNGAFVAEDPVRTYLVTERTFTTDESLCAFVPAFAWSDDAVPTTRTSDPHV